MSIVFASGKHIMLDHLASKIDEVSLHSAAPNSSGSNELSGGTPAYERMAPTFGAASNGEVALTESIEFNVPPASTVAYIGFWVEGTIVARSALTNPETYTGQGKYTVQVGTKLVLADPS